MLDRDEHDEVLIARFARSRGFAERQPPPGPTKAPEVPEAAPPSPAASDFGNVDREARKSLESVAVASAAQRAAIAARRAKPKRDKLVNFKTTADLFARLDAVAAHAGITMTDLIERGITLAIAEHVSQSGRTEADVIAAGAAAAEAKRSARKKRGGNDGDT